MITLSSALRRQALIHVALSLLLAACVLVMQRPETASAAVACPVPVAGTPAISLAKNAPSKALYAQPFKVTLKASQPASPPGAPESGYNLSFREVLTPGTSYVPGSSTVAPQIIDDQPALGYTTLIFSNVADLAPNSDYSLSYSVQYDTSMYVVGDTVETGIATAPAAAGAYVNCDPRQLPRFDANGLPTGTPANSYSSFATAAPSATELTAVQISKSEPSPEAELLRGVHQNKTVYTIKLKNNTVNPSADLTVEDYLPAGLEFLGCGNADNTTDSPSNPGSPFEYPGSGTIAAGPTPGLPEGCPAPESVEFGSFDPDGAGPAPTGLYTRVFWNLGPAADLTPSAEFTFNYVAGIPICPNTTTWTGATPTPESLGQTANLDNNSCAGGETTDETALTNYATVDANYFDGPIPQGVSDTTSHTVTAEDLSIWKESVPNTYEVGALNRWKLHVRTSEYRTFDNVAITDVAPNGTCPVVGTSPASPSSDPECVATGNAADNPIPSWSSANENPDGSWNVDFSLGSLGHNQDTVVEFSTRTREFYQSGFADAGPVLSGDSLANNVDIQGNAYPICSTNLGVIPCVGPTPPYIEHTETPGLTITDDHSVVIINTHNPTLDKQVADPASLPQPVNCSTGAGATYSNGPAGLYRPGDVVCWKLRVNFQSGISTGGVVLTDFLPPGTSYLAGVPGTGPTPASDVVLDPIVDNGTYIEFPFADSTVDISGHVFEYIIATVIDNSGADPAAPFPPIRGNLLKLSTSNTAGQVTTYRDQVEAEGAAPIIALEKGVDAVNGNTGIAGKPDSVVVNGGDVVTFHADVSNSGPIDAVDAVVEENIIAPYTCADLSNYANLGVAASATCVNNGGGGAKLTWTGVDIPAGDTTRLTFDFTVSDASAPFVPILDTACVYSYANETNRPFPNDRYTHFPDNSAADCTPPPGPTNIPPANDTSAVTGGGSFVKSQQTSVNETNNDLTNQATIGEQIDYTVAFTLPQHMSVTNMTIDDPIATGLTLVGGSVAGQLDGGALPGGMSVGTPSGVPTLTIGTYTNTTNLPQVFTLKFSVTVDNLPAASNVSGTTRNNTARRTFTDQFGVAHTNVNSNTTTTTIVEPNPGLAKNENDANDIVSPGQEIEYTLTLTNPNRASGPASSPLHESVVEDNVPVGLTPTDGSGTPLADGATVRRCDGTTPSPSGIWSSGARTITWNVGDVAPLASTPLRYCTEVDSSPAPSGGQILTNTATLTGTSLSGVVSGERTYTRNASDQVTVAGAAMSKSISDPTPTIGQSVTFTVTGTLPANTVFYGFRVADTVPTGYDNVNFVSYNCTAGCPPTPAAPTVSNVGNIYAFDFGDIAAAPTTRTLELKYTARVADIPTNQQDAPLVNSAAATWCRVVTVPCPINEIASPVPASATATLTEPNLTIDKDVNCQTGDADSCNVQPGDSFTYSITVANTGNEIAYDSLVQDAMPSGLTNVVIGPLPGGVSAATPTGGNTNAWTIATLAPGASVTITYTADLTASSQLNDGMTQFNTAVVSSYWGLSLLDRTANPDARTYPEGAKPTDTVTLTVRLPQPTLAKTVANSGNAEINQPLGWTLSIGNSSTTADFNDIDVVDTLPDGWDYVPGSALLDGLPLADPTITTGTTLTWANVGDIAAGGANKVITFDATPTMAALDVGGDPTNPYTNNATINGHDASGATGYGTPETPYEASDSADANIQMPNLTIAKTPDSGTATAGADSSFSIKVSNAGPGTARDLVVTDDLPSGLSYTAGTATASGGAGFTEDSVTVNGDGSTTIVWTFTSLAASADATITLPVHVSIGTPDGTIYTNTAKVHSTERPTDISDNGSLVIGEETDLGVVKSVSSFNGDAGDNITYSIVATNYGPSNATNVHVTDVVDTSQFNFVSADGTSPDSCSYDGPSHTIDCAVSGTLSPLLNPTRTFTVVLQVKSGLTGSVSNTATVAGDQPEPVPDPHANSSTVNTPLGTTADLVVTKAVSTGEPSTILNQDQTEFTITVENKGPSDALNVTLDDDVPAGLSCVSTTEPGGVSASGCPGAAGADVTWTIGTLQAGDTVTLTMVVRGELVGAQLNTGTADSTTTLINPGDDSASATVTVNPMADMQIDKSGPATVNSGDDFTYTLDVINNGPDAAQAVVVSDPIPTGFTYLSNTTDRGTCGLVSGTVVCALGAMNPSETATITITVNAGYGHSEDTVTNTATVTSTTPDTVPNNISSWPVDVGPNADLAIVKSGPAFGAEGYALTYTLSVINNGPATADAAQVEDVLPAGLTFQSASSTVGTCTESSGTVSCGLGDMVVGATAQITIVVVPQASLIGTTIHNTATVSSTTPDPVVPNNQSSVDTPIENNAYPTSSNVTITKVASNTTPKVGDTITYTLTASNSGPDTARGVVITDTLPSSLLYVSSSSGCKYSAPAVTCQLGDIPAGGSSSVTITVVVAKTGTIVNSATVTASNDRDPGDNTAVSPITAGKSTAKLSLTKAANRKTVRVGEHVKYTIKVKNISKTTAVNVEVCDLIPARLSVVKGDGGKLKSGNLCWTVQTLAPGKSRTYKPTFRVANGRGTTVTNSVRANANNASTVRAKARVSVPKLAPHGGGTTG